jgi:hypothetical protein
MLPTLFTRRSREAVNYQVSLAINPARIDAFDAWLKEHVREMLAFPGFQRATIYHGPDDTDGNAIRVVAYEVRTRRELESYLHTHAAHMRQDGVKRFGKDMAASRDIVPLAEYQPDNNLAVMLGDAEISGGLPICGNCHQPVGGAFCANCGQEDRTYLLSLAELVMEFFGELTNVDSRFYRSLKPLLFKPGWLTMEYIRGRRQRYFPPIRLYIIVSLLFFFIAAMMADSGLGDADFEAFANNDSAGDQQDIAAAIRGIETRLEGAQEQERLALEQVLKQLREQQQDASPAKDDSAASTGDEDEDEYESGGFPSLRINSDGSTEARGWGSASLDERLARGAEVIKENPRAFVRTLIDNIPAMMFVFLPLIAFGLKILYPFSRRYYVEHLIFSLHLHSAVFLILLFWMLFGGLADAFEPLAIIEGWLTAAVWIYIPVYLYKAMRRVYGQGHIMTSIKFFLLFNAYVTATVITAIFLVLGSIYMQA